MIVHVTLKQLFIFFKMYRTQAVSFILQQESNKIHFACHPLVFRLGNSMTSAQRKQVRYDRLPLGYGLCNSRQHNILLANTFISLFVHYIFICLR